MRKPNLLSSRVRCELVGVLLVVLTAVFVLVPYALQRHPWESGASLAATTSQQVS
jgi:hypothetical protein